MYFDASWDLFLEEAKTIVKKTTGRITEDILRCKIIEILPKILTTAVARHDSISSHSLAAEKKDALINE